MIVEAYVQKKINENTVQCLIPIGKNKTKEQLFTFYPLNKKTKTEFSIDEIVNQAIYIWKHPNNERETMYIGKIFYFKEQKVFVINQAIEEIYKRIE